MQKRLVRKLELERLLSQVKPYPHPKPNLEQYTIPTDVAATILYMAAYTYNDIIGKTVLDLGCGTGRLALGAAFLGAKQVVGVDIDNEVVKFASKNAVEVNLKEKVQWINGDIGVICRRFETVLQNPPFGVQQPKADRKFLEKALEVGKVVYSLHKSPKKDKKTLLKLKTNKKVILSDPSPFFKKFIMEHDGEIKAVYSMLMTVPYMFTFHRKKKHEFIVDLYIIENKIID